MKHQGFVKALYWAFALFLVGMNVIPLGKADSSLSSNKVSFLRLDYLVHAVIMLGFAWVYLLPSVLEHIYLAQKKS